ncbi:MAG: endoglucanase, partial [Acidimicrobiaceae bacterium]|nr:endoglucanase [Acidimicrobiaceae bacterium]
MRPFRWWVVVTVLVVGVGLVPVAQAAPAPAAASVVVKVSGNKLVDGLGRPLRLLGVNRSGTEYACIQGWGIFDGPSDATSVAAIAA